MLFASVVAGIHPFTYLKKGSYYMAFNLANNETKEIGEVSGLLVIRDTAASSKPTVYLVDEFANTVTYVAGRENLQCEFTFSTKSVYGGLLSIKNTKGSFASFRIVCQALSQN